MRGDGRSRSLLRAAHELAKVAKAEQREAWLTTSETTRMAHGCRTSMEKHCVRGTKRERQDCCAL